MSFGAPTKSRTCPRASHATLTMTSCHSFQRLQAEPATSEMMDCHRPPAPHPRRAETRSSERAHSSASATTRTVKRHESRAKPPKRPNDMSRLERARPSWVLAIVASIAMLLSHIVPSPLKLASCYQFMGAPVGGGAGNRASQQRAPSPPLPFDINQLPTLSSDTAHLLSADFSDLPGDQGADVARKWNPHTPPAALGGGKLNGNNNNIIFHQQDLMFASPSADEEFATASEGTSFGATPPQQPLVQPLIMPKLASLFMPIANQQQQQPLAFKSLINGTLLQQQHSNLGRAIEATRTFVRQQQALAAAGQPSAGSPRTPRIPLPSAVSNRLYNFLFQSRNQQQQQQQQQQQPQPQPQINSSPVQEANIGAAEANTNKRTIKSLGEGELIQTASSESRDSISARNRPSLVTLSAPYEQRPHSTPAGERIKPDNGGKGVNLMPAASGHHSFTAAFARPNAATDWRLPGENSTSGDGELVAPMLEGGDPRQQEQQNQALPQQQQFVVGSEESEGGQQFQDEQQQQQQQQHLMNLQQDQDQANAELQASLQSGQEEENNQPAQMEIQGADQPQELAGYIEQVQQQQQHEEVAAAVEAEQQAQVQKQQTTGDDGAGNAESIYLTPGRHRAGRNTTTTALVPVNESDLPQEAAANLQGDDSSLAAQLPSQYDSTLRLPPDGHYDDYFKPSGGEQTMSGSGSSLDQQQEGALLQPQEFFTAYNVMDSNQTHQQERAQVQRYNQSSASDVEQLQRLPAGFFQPQMVRASGDNGTEPLDYTARYYMNQPRQGATPASSERAVEFGAANNQSAPSGHGPKHKFLQQLASADAGRPPKSATTADDNGRQQQHHYHLMSSSNATIGRAPDNHQYAPHGRNRTAPMEEHRVIQADDTAGGERQVFLAPNEEYRVSWNQTSASQPPATNQTEDSIQLIVANSNGFHDPETNERVITYTSEGHNFTRPNGKSARNTFFNKDLNEIPSSAAEVSSPTPSSGSSSGGGNGTSANKVQAHELLLQIQPKFRSTRSPALTLPASGPNQRVVVLVNKQPPQQQYRLEANATQAPQQALSTERSDEEADDESAEGAAYEADGDEQAASNHPGQFGERQQAGPSKPRRAGPAAQGSHDHHSNQANNKSAIPKTNKLKGHEPQPARVSRTQRSRARPRNQHRHHQSQSKGVDQQPMRAQQTMKRPQVTEARFQLKDLALNAPTAMPSIGESTMKSIETLPVKVRQLRNNQLDKNELMNELLTALDRVKAAIYKLQPLTAKMNAMYRKSVTSNTRDHIMDNHKGTYAKRYPPGDFDDTYDRMHPSELIDRNRGQQRAARRRRGERNAGRPTGEPMEASDSKPAAVYLAAPARNFSATPGDSFQRRDNSAPEVEIVASGVGKRTGAVARQMRGRLSFNTPMGERQIIYDDDDGDHHHHEGSAFERFGSSSANDLALETSGASSPDATSWGSFARRADLMNSSDSQATTANPLDETQTVQGPLFGYRITIYQPSEGDSESDGTANDSTSGQLNKLLSYSLVSDPASQELSFNAAPAGPGDPVYELTSASESPAHLEAGEGADTDLMATSESSLTPAQSDDEPEQLEGSESASKRDKKLEMSKEEKKHKKSFEEEEGHKKKEKKEQGDKKGEKWAKHQARHKKGEEEHKKRKEFKKIKHSKGVMSKESHKLHRDKHIKAHDRGAAKEKALKERTQIEFFEREQIVDDEFEKGKKSTMKAGWASGHDAKKVDKEMHGGDSMSMGGSQNIRRMETAPSLLPPPPPSPPTTAATAMVAAASEHHHHGAGGSYLEKGHGNSVETSSGKQSNKFEKKHMEARGKKFKGWREKGYKIITETEFIDRGSLHDSAYKKRDKGAAHHQKFKKHEANSEGQHGSMHEHHKKSLKKEEKKSKVEEKKKEVSGKEEGEKAKKQRKANKKASVEKKKHKHHEEKKGHHEDDEHDQEESSPSMASVGQGLGMQIYPANSDDEVDEPQQLVIRRVDQTTNKNHPPASMQTGSSTLRPTILPLPVTVTARTSQQPANIIRFLPTDYRDLPIKSAPSGQSTGDSSGKISEASNISRRSSDGGAGSHLNSSSNSTQGKNETRSETGRLLESGSPQLRLVSNSGKQPATEPSVYNERRTTSAPQAPRNSPFLVRDALAKPTPEPPYQDRAVDSGRDAFRASPLDRLSRVLAQLTNQARLSEPLNAPLNLGVGRSSEAHNFEPPNRFEQDRSVFNVAGQNVRDFGSLMGLLSKQPRFSQQQQQPTSQPTFYQPQLYQNLPPMPQQQVYPQALLLPPQQRFAEQSNQLDLVDNFNAFDLEPDQMNSALHQTLTAHMNPNSRYQQATFGNNIFTR